MLDDGRADSRTVPCLRCRLEELTSLAGVAEYRHSRIAADGRTGKATRDFTIRPIGAMPAPVRDGSRGTRCRGKATRTAGADDDGGAGAVSARRRTTRAPWREIGSLLDRFEPAERANRPGIPATASIDGRDDALGVQLSDTVGLSELDH